MKNSVAKIKQKRSRLLYLLGVMALIIGLESTTMSEESKDQSKNAAIPVRLDPDKVAGIGLSPGEPFIAPEDIIEGSHRPRGDMLFKGEQLVMEIFEDNAASYKINDPFPVDEYVLVMSGKLVLTVSQGTVHEYTQGDSLVVPKGFTGIWKMEGNYRELIAIDRKSYDEIFGSE